MTLIPPQSQLREARRHFNTAQIKQIPVRAATPKKANRRCQIRKRHSWGVPKRNVAAMKTQRAQTMKKLRECEGAGEFVTALLTGVCGSFGVRGSVIVAPDADSKGCPAGLNKTAEYSLLNRLKRKNSKKRKKLKALNKTSLGNVPDPNWGDFLNS